MLGLRDEAEIAEVVPIGDDGTGVLRGSGAESGPQLGRA
jgi:hypothetical protein